MARNRKRRNDRRGGRRGEAQPGVATASAARRDADQAPDPIEHAAPDVELAQAQLALGRPGAPVGDAGENGGALSDEELDAEALGDPGAGNGGGGWRGGRRGGGGGGGDGSGGELTPTPASSPAARAGAATRLVHFVQGSWRELQRVQWPDRRQVMQATGVVIGFVIVAGVFLGVADFVAGKVVNFILQ